MLSVSPCGDLGRRLAQQRFQRALPRQYIAAAGAPASAASGAAAVPVAADQELSAHPAQDVAQATCLLRAVRCWL